MSVYAKSETMSVSSIDESTAGEPADRGQEGDDEREISEPGQRHVDVEDPVDVPLDRVGGRPEQRHHARHHERSGGSDAEPGTDARHPVRRTARDGGVCHSMAAGTMVRPMTVYTTENANKRPAHDSAPTASPESAALVPRVAATSCGTSTGSARIGTSAARARRRSARTTSTMTMGGRARTPGRTTTMRWTGSATGRARRTSERMRPTTPPST